MYADLVTCSSFEIFMQKSSFFLLTLKSEHLSTSSLQKISKLVKENNIEMKQSLISQLDLEPADEECQKLPKEKVGLLYQNNKVAQHILQEFAHIESVNNQSQSSFKNPFKSLKLFEHFSKKNLPFCIAWSSFYSGYSTNNNAEAYNKIVKVDVLNTQKRLKPTKFLLKLRENTLSNIKLVKYGLKTKSSKKKRH